MSQLIVSAGASAKLEGIVAPVPDLLRTIIQPSRGWIRLDLAELWRYRELLTFAIRSASSLIETIRSCPNKAVDVFFARWAKPENYSASVWLAWTIGIAAVDGYAIEVACCIPG
jgi:hypothetical protein